jgi:fibro-slime domain-containing protein
VLLAAIAVAGACTAYDDTPPDNGVEPGAGGSPDEPSPGKGGSAGKAGSLNLGEMNMGGCDPDAEDCGGGGSTGMEAVCSDGRHDPGEACDDGNVVSGDGCTATCAQVEAEYVCPTPGEACVSTQKCGDNKITSAESCDDGQGTPRDGDGCDATCQLEEGWACPIPGEPCMAAACGDGIVAGSEQCEDDDAVPASSDGCSATCQLEPGYACDPVGAACHKTVCNDGVKEGSEPCDDGDNIVGDGCTPLCQVEPACPNQGGTCSSRCGDGLILPTDDEDCDDGNTVDGDGCSATCSVEDGYMCAPVQGALPETIQIPFVFRDFVSIPASGTPQPRHPDFNGGCRGIVQEGMITDTLDLEGKPVNSGLCDLPLTCTVNNDYVNTGDFCYRRDDCAGMEPTGCLGMTHANHPIPGHLTEDPFKFWYRDTAGVNHTKVTAVTMFKNVQNVYTYNPGGLYPIDNFGWVASNEELPFNITGNPPLHNYGFTTEVRSWFQFNGGEVLTFSGDDDLWVFVNAKLALDIGGKHGQTNRTLTLNADGSGSCAPAADCVTDVRQLGITPGNVYEIVLFHAERQTAASNFSLSLSGFVERKSICQNVCGDGIVTAEEECDNGQENGQAEHNGCSIDCKRGPYCGDGVVDMPFEDCDDSVNLSQYGGCAPGCKAGPYCGDGAVQSQFEECDDGVFAGEYNGCSEGCVLGPRCGDEEVQEEQGESCDDGNRQNLDGCSSKCLIEEPE